MRALRLLAAPAVLAGRRLRSDLTLTVVVFAVVAFTAFLFAAAPRVLNRSADEGLRFAVGKATPYERNVEVDRAGRVPSGPAADPIAAVREAGTRYEQRFPSSVRDVLSGRRTSVETVRFQVVNAPGEPGPAGTTRFLTLRFLSDMPQHLRLDSGRTPKAGAPDVEIPFRGEQHSGPLLEIAVSTEAAGLLSLEVGDLIYLAPDTQDTLVRDVPLSEHRFLAARVTGLLEQRGSDDSDWLRDSRLGRPVIRDTETRRLVFGYSYFSGEAYGDVARAVRPFPLRYEWRYDVNARGFDAGDFGRFGADVRKLDAEFGRTTYGQTVGVGVRTGLSAVLARFKVDRDAARAALAIAAVALLAVALAVIALLARLAVQQRGDAVALVRSRGASTAQVLVAEWVQGLAIAAPAGALGYAWSLAVGGRESALSAWLVFAIVLATATVLMGAAVGPARRPTVLQLRPEARPATAAGRRVALEAFVVVLSLLGVYLLRRRGVSTEGGFDVYLVAVPLLLGLAAGVLAARLYPLPARALALGAGRRPDLVPALGFQRASREPTVTAPPLLVVLVAVSVAVFAASMAATLADAQEGLPTALSPIATGTVHAFRVATGLAAIYAALALVLAPLLTATARLRDGAYLQALGLTRRQGLSLTAIELGPPLAVALVLGISVGLTVAYAVAPGLDLAPLAAGRSVATRVDAVAALLIALGLVFVLAAALTAFAVAALRTSPSRVLRMGER
jgi:putative ABC transport system permease protein